MSTVFVCDDEEEILQYLKKLLQASGYQVETFSKGADLLARLEPEDAARCDVILLDVKMPALDGHQVLKRTQKLYPEIPVLMLTASGSIDDAVHAMKLGAYDYLTKPFPKQKLLGMLERMLDHCRLAQENCQLRKNLHRTQGAADTIVFISDAFREVYDLTLQVAESEANILIMGESGTGKELIANTLHQNSSRRGKPFVSLNCATLTDTLLESQLFGHIRGAFTGAVMNQNGLLEEADGGTLFLDEIGDVSPMIQAKLLRVTQEKSFNVLGSTRCQKADVRFVAATNKDLLAEVHAGRFREDLYYRLNVITITLPPLRERRDDIEPLARHFLGISTRKMKKDVLGIDEAALQALEQYDWPGNVRELENIIERAVILARGRTLTTSLLPWGGHLNVQAAAAVSSLAALGEVERNHIATVLRETGYQKSRAAEILGISRKTLDRKIAEIGLGERRN